MKKVRKTTKQFIIDAKAKHGDLYDYSLAKYTTAHDKVTIVCNEHGPFEQVASEHLKGYGCKECKKVKISKAKRKAADAFTIQASAVHSNKYDYSSVEYKTTHDIVTIKCPIHGSFDQRAYTHLLGNGCAKCGTVAASDFRRKSTEQFVCEAVAVHGDRYSYNDVNYTSTKDPVEIICKDHGSFWRTAESHLKGYGCSDCLIGSSSKGEDEVADLLNSWGCDITRSNRTLIKPHELDIVVRGTNVAIEFNGMYWHSDVHDRIHQRFHLDKWNKCKEAGIRLITIWEHQWNNDRDKVVSILRNAVRINTNKIPARKISIREISGNQATEFHRSYHLDSGLSSSVNIGGFNGDDLVCVLSLSKARMKRKEEWEITRFSTVSDTTVVGGLAKTFKHFIRKYDPESVVSYSKNDVYLGGSYSKIGFEFSGLTQPNYMYWKRNCVIKRYQAQKHKLHKILDNFDPSLSEYQNMVNHGYFRVWDCGNTVWIWKKTTYY